MDIGGCARHLASVLVKRFLFISTMRGVVLWWVPGGRKGARNSASNVNANHYTSVGKREEREAKSRHHLENGENNKMN